MRKRKRKKNRMKNTKKERKRMRKRQRKKRKIKRVPVEPSSLLQTPLTHQRTAEALSFSPIISQNSFFLKK